MTWERQFAELGEYYPGSSKRIERSAPKPVHSPQENSWDSTPRIGIRDGREYEFFTIRHLAAALDKKPVTIRLWETKGYIPLSGQRSASLHPDKRHRLYTRPQIEGIVRIAGEEGILHEVRPKITRTRFVERVLDLFIELAQQPYNGARPLDGQ